MLSIYDVTSGPDTAGMVLLGLEVGSLYSMARKCGCLSISSFLFWPFYIDTLLYGRNAARFAPRRAEGD